MENVNNHDININNINNILTGLFEDFKNSTDEEILSQSFACSVSMECDIALGLFHQENTEIEGTIKEQLEHKIKLGIARMRFDNLKMALEQLPDRVDLAKKFCAIELPFDMMCIVFLASYIIEEPVETFDQYVLEAKPIVFDLIRETLTEPTTGFEVVRELSNRITEYYEKLARNEKFNVKTFGDSDAKEFKHTICTELLNTRGDMTKYFSNNC